MFLLRLNLDYCLKENLNCSHNGIYVRVHTHVCIPSAEKANIVVDFIILSEWEERPCHYFDLVKSTSQSC